MCVKREGADEKEYPEFILREIKKQQQTTLQAPTNQENVTQVSEEEVFNVVEVQPEFPGGTQALMKYLSDNIKYPSISQENGSQGRAYINFIVDTDGSITDVKVMRSSGDVNLDKEAVRVVSGMPKWKPGKQGDRTVRVRYTLPIKFELIGAATPTTGTINGHEWVDLGLSIKWATCNVGASSPSDYGNYYAWGETTTKSEYTEENSKTYNKNIGDIAGNAAYDAASANWGGSWRLPIKIEWRELKNNCTWQWTIQGGRNGYKVTSKKNGKNIFLPAAGYCSGSLLASAGNKGYYWSSIPYDNDVQRANYVYFDSSDYYLSWGSRDIGHSVRPVTK
jgi:TonB family protein